MVLRAACDMSHQRCRPTRPQKVGVILPGRNPFAGLDIRPTHVEGADGDGILAVHGQKVASSKYSLCKPNEAVSKQGMTTAVTLRV